MKKCLIVMMISILSLSMIYAQQADDEDVYGKRIELIEFENLIHADTKVLDAVTSRYVGKQYTDELFNSLQAELYALQYFSYFYAYAGRTGQENEQLTLTFSVKELPFVTSVTFKGNSFFDRQELNDKINTAERGFFNNSLVSGDVKILKEAYVSKGFINSTVETVIDQNTEENTVDVTFMITEGKQSKIDVIDFAGNDTYSSSSLKRVLTSKEQSLFNKGEYSEANIQLDRNAILTYYRERGYVDAVITDVTIDVDSTDASKDLVTMTFVIDEGLQWKFGGLTVEGNTIFDDQTLQAAITLQVGDPINITRMQQDISKIADLYWNEGYIYNDIIPNEQRNERDRTISYELSITEKQQAYIEDIVIKGAARTKDYVLYRELTIEIGDIFSKEKFIESVQNLYNTGIIANVDYDVLFGSSDGLIVLEFIVEESNKVDLQFGATFGGTDDFPVSGFLSWTDKNFTGRGQDFSISTNIASSTQSLDFSYQDAWLAQQRWSGGLSFSMSHSNFTNILQDRSGTTFDDEQYYEGTAAPDPYNSYTEYLTAVENGESIGSEHLMDYEQYKLSLGLNTGYTFHTDAGRIGVGGGLFVGLTRAVYDPDLYRPYNPIIRNNLDNWKFSNKMNLNFSWDGRDLVENTTSGFLFEDTITYAGGLLGGTSEYIKNRFGASGFLTLLRLNDNELNPTNVVLSARTSVSNIFPQFFSYDSGFGLLEQPVATQSEKLYIDGMNIVRGISQPIYNLEFLWDTTVDISIPIAKNVLAGEVFASATGYKNQYENIADLSIDDFYFSTGAGIKLTVPGFPLGLYLTKVFSYDSDAGQIVYQGGDVFRREGDDTSGLNLVLAITYSLY